MRFSYVVHFLLHQTTSVVTLYFISSDLAHFSTSSAFTQTCFHVFSLWNLNVSLCSPAFQFAIFCGQYGGIFLWEQKCFCLTVRCVLVFPCQVRTSISICTMLRKHKLSKQIPKVDCSSPNPARLLL